MTLLLICVRSTLHREFAESDFSKLSNICQTRSCAQIFRFQFLPPRNSSLRNIKIKMNWSIYFELRIIILSIKEVKTLVLNTFCPSFLFVQESCTSGVDRGVNKAYVARPLVWECTNVSNTYDTTSSTITAHALRHAYEVNSTVFLIYLESNTSL